MIGFYDYTVVLTYFGLMSSVFGMTQAIEGRFKTAIFCLALSGLCDLFDGKVARSKKDRTEEGKDFGIQIDSLCDLVCFGIFPGMICYLLGVRGTLGVIVICYYCMCGVIRLAYFNVLEISRQKEEGGANKYYHGLPITTSAILLPLCFMTNFILPDSVFRMVLLVFLFVVGTLFIVDIKIKKPSNKFNIIQIVVGAIAVIIIIVFSRYKVGKSKGPEPSLVDDIGIESTTETPVTTAE